MNSKGFTLLEVLVAVVILAVSLTALLNIQSNYIDRVHQDFQRLEALKFFKKHFYGLKVSDDRFLIKTKKETLPYSIKQVSNIILFRKTGKKVLTVITYEK